MAHHVNIQPAADETQSSEQGWGSWIGAIGGQVTDGVQAAAQSTWNCVTEVGKVAWDWAAATVERTWETANQGALDAAEMIGRWTRPSVQALLEEATHAPTPTARAAILLAAAAELERNNDPISLKLRDVLLQEAGKLL